LLYFVVLFLTDSAPTEIYTLSLHDALPIFGTLTLIADNGNIQQGSVAFTANTLIASATQSIELGTSQNNSIAHLGNISSSTGDVDRKSTRLNSSHVEISYAVFCLKKKNKQK